MATAGIAAGDVELARAEHKTSWLVRYLVPPATIVALAGLALLPLLTPVWIHAAIDLAGGQVPGGGAAVAHSVSDRTVGALLLGGDFAITLPNGRAIFTADEMDHLRDVRIVLYAFLALAAAAWVVVLVSLRGGARDSGRWRSVGRGAAGLLVGLVALALVGVLAFDLAFETFHRLLFPGGNFAFPADSNLIRLYPYAFWQLGAGAYGALIAVFAALVWLVARRRAAAPMGR